MPSFAPRNEPRKKKEELDLKKQVLENAVLNSLSMKILTKKAEIYKAARISYNKAILHVAKDMEWKNIEHSFDKDKAAREIEIWEKKSVETVISEVQTQLKPKETS
jgi:hypothetical protein